MGKKNKSSSNLGRSLIKDRFGVNKGRKLVDNNTMLHTTEIQDGYDWGRLNLQSVTEESSFQEFLSTAELAGTEFQGEKLNIKFVNPRSNVGILTADETKKMKAEHEEHKQFIKIPRRPPWTSETTRDELERMEREYFLEWRKGLATLQENEGLLLTPFEKNLEFWRQLWRVVERSDVIIQIVDARNPLLFRCEDLEKYVKEVSPDKINVILINKADFLTEEQRQIWAKYFDENNVRVAFYSALESTEEELTKIKEEEEEEEEEENDDLTSETSEDNDEDSELKSEEYKNVKEKLDNLMLAVDATEEKLKRIQNDIDTAVKNIQLAESDGTIRNSSKLLSKDELINLFKTIHHGPKVTQNLSTVGLVGYPNVGKSSTINSLFLSKKVSVSATPGKTKHFQTLFLDKDLLLCDCPGLVMPSFVFTKAEMVISGILPIDQMRDHVPPVNLVTSLIPKHVIEDKYGIMLPQPEDGEDPERPPTSEELLNAYGFNRGFMTANGQPDNPRSARYILKDFVNGKLLYCHAPPGIQQNTFHIYPEKSRADRLLPPRELRAIKANKVTGNDLDQQFFKVESKGVHAKGVAGKSSGVPSNLENTCDSISKPWKKENKHANKKKREKLRRVYSHLDQH